MPPTQRRRPPTIMPRREHSASHSSILTITTSRFAFGNALIWAPKPTQKLPNAFHSHIQNLTILHTFASRHLHTITRRPQHLHDQFLIRSYLWVVSTILRESRVAQMTSHILRRATGSMPVLGSYRNTP